MKDKGILLHAKHAYMPNTLGYCGPDARGLILQHLEESKGGEDLASTLKEFEAAYPFLRLIARSTGRDPFEYAVPEAYWIGNSLLERVQVPEFYKFSHRELVGKDPNEVKRVFKSSGGAVRPHHSFYVMSTYVTSSVATGPNLFDDGAKKIQELVDNCRISWGRVVKAEPSTLTVECRPIRVVDGSLRLSAPMTKKVNFNPEVRSFSGIKSGDWVSLHWNYACEVLTPRQLKNLAKYTDLDIRSTNEILGRVRTKR